MKVLFSSNKNPDFTTITEYIENALGKECEYVFFENRVFILPGRIRDKVPVLNKLDLLRINKNILSLSNRFKPDIFLEAGGHRILPQTIEKIKKMGIKTVLWTIDAPLNFKPVIKAAPHYDFVFTGGSEAFEILKDYNLKNLYWLPFACDPEIHKQVNLTDMEKAIYGADISFVGTINPHLYHYRVKALEAVSDFNPSILGPGGEFLPDDSPLKPFIRGRETPVQVWTKIYAASKIVLCIHYRDPQGKIPCYQASPRVYEALACGAFLVVDAQDDVLRLFKDREEVVVFRDMEELREILKYYLENPEERKKIAHRGREKVLREHTYLHRVQTMLDIVLQ